MGYGKKTVAWLVFEGVANCICHWAWEKQRSRTQLRQRDVWQPGKDTNRRGVEFLPAQESMDEEMEYRVLWSKKTIYTWVLFLSIVCQEGDVP